MIHGHKTAVLRYAQQEADERKPTVIDRLDALALLQQPVPVRDDHGPGDGLDGRFFVQVVELDGRNLARTDRLRGQPALALPVLYKGLQRDRLGLGRLGFGLGRGCGPTGAQCRHQALSLNLGTLGLLVGCPARRCCGLASVLGPEAEGNFALAVERVN